MPAAFTLSLALTAGLLLLCLAGFAWWLARRRRQEAQLVFDQAIASPDPRVRQAAVETAGHAGLSPHAGSMLALAEREPDVHVRQALVAAVRRSQWEPATDPRLVALRLWAAQQNADGSVDPRGTGSRPSPLPAGEEPFVGLTVLVTGAGGPAGVSVIRALQAKGVHVVAADADRSAVGLRLAEAAGVIPLSTSSSFAGKVQQLARAHSAAVLISTVAEELAVLTTHADALAADGIATWLPTVDALDICIDKWRFAEHARNAGLPAPATGLGSARSVPGPWIVKPRFGRGSRDVHSADAVDELTWLLGRVPEPLVQTRVDGREFTVDALVDRDGTVAGAVPRWRLETKAGISTKGATFTNQALLDVVQRLVASTGITGPVNVQGFVRGEEQSIVVIEMNPRFSGGLPLSLAAGADLVGEYVRGVLGLPLRAHRLTYSSGVKMARYFEEVFER